MTNMKDMFKLVVSWRYKKDSNLSDVVSCGMTHNWSVGFWGVTV